MQQYLAFLRGVNVGGKALLKMADLRECLLNAGLQEVQTYIQSGNVIFQSEELDKQALGHRIAGVLRNEFNLEVAVAIFTTSEWQSVIAKAPGWWGKDPSWKHNILILTETLSSQSVVDATGQLKPDIERLAAGDGVVYQSMSFIDCGKTTTGKLASNPIYRKLTIRNYNTATKLLSLLR